MTITHGDCSETALNVARNVSMFPSIGHSTILEENHGPIKQMMEQIKYVGHNWLICVDLKMVTVLLGQQSGYTNIPYFLCS